MNKLDSNKKTESYDEYLAKRYDSILEWHNYIVNRLNETMYDNKLLTNKNVEIKNDINEHLVN
jgi:hypothetical protein